MKSDWTKEIKVEDLPEVYQTIAEVIGVEHTVKLARALGGTYCYLPKLDKLLQEIRDRRIKQEFTGFNHKKLALKYGLSEIRIRQILGGGDERQECLF